MVKTSIRIGGQFCWSFVANFYFSICAKNLWKYKVDSIGQHRLPLHSIARQKLLTCKLRVIVALPTCTRGVNACRNLRVSSLSCRSHLVQSTVCLKVICWWTWTVNSNLLRMVICVRRLSLHAINDNYTHAQCTAAVGVMGIAFHLPLSVC